jgi:hypothetical protein
MDFGLIHTDCKINVQLRETTMPETVSINKRLGVIQIDSYGDVDRRDLNSSLQSVLEIVEKTGLKKVLVDTTKQTKLPSILNLHHFGEELSTRARTLKHAVVISQLLHEDFQFIETVSVNRGVNMRIFDAVGDALAWLNE